MHCLGASAKKIVLTQKLKIDIRSEITTLNMMKRTVIHASLCVIMSVCSWLSPLSYGGEYVSTAMPEGLMAAFEAKNYAAVESLLNNCENFAVAYIQLFDCVACGQQADDAELRALLRNSLPQSVKDELLVRICRYNPPKFNFVRADVIEQLKLSFVKELLANNADIQAEQNRSVAYDAAFYGEYELMFYLIECGADVNYVTVGGDTILGTIILANARNDAVRICKRLLRYEPNWNIGMPQPLFFAIDSHSVELADMLIAAGASLDWVIPRYGITLRQYAREMKVNIGY